MSWDRTRYFDRDDEAETEVEVSFTIHSAGDPGNGWDDPGSGPEVEITGAKVEKTGEAVELTTAEVERIERALSEDPDLCDFMDDDPGDYYAD